MIEYYATAGPAWQSPEQIEKIVKTGLTGIRLNLSHTSLEASRERIQCYREIAERLGKKPEIIMDLKGPEMRVGWLKSRMQLWPGNELILKAKSSRESSPVLCAPPAIINAVEPGDHILVHDGIIELEAVEELEPEIVMNSVQETTGEPESGKPDGDEQAEAPAEMPEGEALTQSPSETQEIRRRFRLRVVRGGILNSQQSIKIVGKEVYGPVLTKADLENLDLARELGITICMQPFVRDGADVEALREAIKERGLDMRIFAKIESQTGLQNLDSIIETTDVVVIARGDLGNAVPLWQLPRVQKEIAEKCRAHGRPFMVVTQMLQSMVSRAVPTRAEVSDIFNAVLDGASSVMLTAETSIGEHPVEAVEYLIKTAEEGRRYLEESEASRG